MFAIMKGFCLISSLPFDPTWKVLSIHGLKSLLPNALDCPKVKQKGRQPTLIWSYHSCCFPWLPTFYWQWNTELMRAWNKWNIPQQEIEVNHSLQLLGTKRTSLCIHRQVIFEKIMTVGYWVRVNWYNFISMSQHDLNLYVHVYSIKTFNLSPSTSIHIRRRKVMIFLKIAKEKKKGKFHRTLLNFHSFWNTPFEL